MMGPKEEKGKRYFACSCGYNTKSSGAQKPSVVTETVSNKKDSVEVRTDTDSTLPLTDEVCPQCGHGKAYWWTKQMRASDEPETKFLKCEKCKHTWRDRS
jgi:DNA-directed RNA polymerase subunit M